MLHVIHITSRTACVSCVVTLMNARRIRLLLCGKVMGHACLKFKVRCKQHLMRSIEEGHQQEGRPGSSLSCSAACSPFVCPRESNAEERSSQQVLPNTKENKSRDSTPTHCCYSVI